MKRRIKYTNESIEAEVVKDFLPPPEKLIRREENVKVTITLSKESVNFFKKIAHLRHFPYQKMIRKVLDYYVSHYKSA
jgi:predicted DNA binding CopG/RHH family protein